MRRSLCQHCKRRLAPGEKIHKECIDGYAEAKAAKAARTEAKRAQAEAKMEREATKLRKEAIKTIPVLIREAQIAFNAFIRERDRQAGHACISSGRQLDWSGNAVDAGHYRSTGAASQLRFNEDNCHAQSKHDNQFLSGNAIDYRIRLIERIGIARVEALESDNTPRKWTRDELVNIRNTYRSKLKQLKSAERARSEA